MPESTENCWIVGIGASAGGVTALQTFFRAVPANPSLCFVIIQHFQAGESNSLTQLLTNWSALSARSVRPIIGGDQPKRNHIYVADSDYVSTLEKGLFCVRPAQDGRRRPGIDTIDAFFESLAEDRREQALAVLLSGTGADGAAGAICVKQAGGTVFVQDPSTALYASMPRAAIECGAFDFVLSIGAIARQLSVHASSASTRSGYAGLWGTTSQALNRISEMVRLHACIDLSYYKPTPLLWRIQQRMSFRRVESLEDYEQLLKDEAAEIESLMRNLPIHVTEFFRDPDAWSALSSQAIVPLLHQNNTGDPLRAWTPACASGEEAYTVAMLLSERSEASSKPIDFRVYASDASQEIIARASRGVFSGQALDNVTPEHLSRFFYFADGKYHVKRALREKMVFAPQDLLLDPPFANLDLVTCRNLLIYLHPDAGQHVLRVLNSALRLGGYLLLGQGEPLLPRQQGFEPVSDFWNIYRKTGSAGDIGDFFRRRRTRYFAPATVLNAHRSTVEHIKSPSALVDDELRILRLYGDTSNLLRLPAGQPSDRLNELIKPEFVESLTQAANLALVKRQPVAVSGLYDRDSKDVSWCMRLTPMQVPANGVPRRLLVSFIRAQDETCSDPETNRACPQEGLHAPVVKNWDELMRVSHDELQASREEMKALNKELEAANAQLNKVNLQLEDNIDELEMQSGVMSSGEVMTLFLDQELRIRWYTPATTALFPFIDADIGRSITDIAARFDDEFFVDDVRGVIQNHRMSEAEMNTRDGSWFLRRIRPYLASASPIGVAVTFTDITTLKKTEESLRASEELLRVFISATNDIVYRMSPDWTEMRQLHGRELIADTISPSPTWLNTYIHPDDQQHVMAEIRRAIDAKGVFALKHRVIRLDGSLGWTFSRAVPILNKHGNIVEWFGAASEVIGPQ